MKASLSWTAVALFILDARAATETLEQSRTRILLEEASRIKRQYYGYFGPPAGSIAVPRDCLPGPLSPQQLSQLSGQLGPMYQAPSNGSLMTARTSRPFPFPSSAASCGDTVFVGDIGPYRTQEYGNYNGTLVPWWMEPHTGMYWLVDAQTNFLIYNTAISNINSTYSYGPTIVNAKYISSNATYSSPVFRSASTTVIEQACQVGVRSCGYSLQFQQSQTPSYIARGSLAPMQTLTCNSPITIAIGQRPFPQAEFLDGRTCIVAADLVYTYDAQDTDDEYVLDGVLVPGQRPVETVTRGYYQSYAQCNTTRMFYSSLSLVSCPLPVAGGFTNPLIDPRALKTQPIEVPTIQLQAAALPTLPSLRPPPLLIPSPNLGGTESGSGSNSGSGRAAPELISAPDPSPTQAASSPAIDNGSGSGFGFGSSSDADSGLNAGTGADSAADSGSVPSTGNSGSVAPVQANNVAPGTGVSSPAGAGTAAGTAQTSHNGNAAVVGSGASVNNGGSKPAANAAAGDGQVSTNNVASGGIAPGTSGDVQRSEVLAQFLPEGALPIAPALVSSASNAATAASQALAAAGITPAPQQQQFTDAAGAIGNLRSASSQLASVASTATGSALSSIRAAQSSIAAVLSSVDAVVATASVSIARTTTNAQGLRITTSLLIAATALSLRTSLSTNSAGIVSTVEETDILTSSPSATVQASVSASRSSTSRAGAQLTHTFHGTHLSAAMYGLFVWGLAHF